MDEEVYRTKQAMETKSRKTATSVRTYHAADWGDYNMDLLVFVKGGAQDVPRFLKHLDTLSVFPTTRMDIVAQLTSNLRMLESKNELSIQ